MLAEVRSDGVHDRQDSLDEAQNDEGVLLTSSGNQVAFLDAEKTVEVNHDNTVLHIGVGLLALSESTVDLVHQQVIPQAVLSGIVLREVQRFASDVVLDPLFEDEHVHDGLISDSFIEVGIIEAVTRVSESNSRGIRSVFLDAVADGHEVASGLGHLITVKAEVTIAEVATSHAARIVLPDSLMVVQGHGQMIPDKILARHAQVHWVPVIKLVSQFSQLFFRDTRAFLRIVLFVKEDVVKCFNRQSIGRNARRTELGTLEDATLEHVGNCVVGHVDG